MQAGAWSAAWSAAPASLGPMWPVADKPANEAGLLRPLASPTRRPTCCEAECHDHKGFAGSVPACLHGGWGPSLPSLQQRRVVACPTGPGGPCVERAQPRGHRASGCAVGSCRPGSCWCRRSASPGPMWGPMGRMPANFRPGSNETSKSGFHVTSATRRHMGSKDTMRALRYVRCEPEAPAVWAGWSGRAGRRGPSTRVVTHRGH